MGNMYIKVSLISEQNDRVIIHLFSLDIEAKKTAELTIAPYNLGQCVNLTKLIKFGRYRQMTKVL